MDLEKVSSWDGVRLGQNHTIKINGIRWKYGQGHGRSSESTIGTGRCSMRVPVVVDHVVLTLSAGAYSTTYTMTSYRYTSPEKERVITSQLI